jgi:hypothetical protein
MEQECIDVTPEQMTSFFASLIVTAESVPEHFVMNMDEMGHQDWADRHE